MIIIIEDQAGPKRRQSKHDGQRRHDQRKGTRLRQRRQRRPSGSGHVHATVLRSASRGPCDRVWNRARYDICHGSKSSRRVPRPRLLGLRDGGKNLSSLRAGTAEKAAGSFHVLSHFCQGLLEVIGYDEQALAAPRLWHSGDWRSSAGRMSGATSGTISRAMGRSFSVIVTPSPGARR